jgi:hypothetical protein
MADLLPFVSFLLACLLLARLAVLDLRRSKRHKVAARFLMLPDRDVKECRRCGFRVSGIVEDVCRRGGVDPFEHKCRRRWAHVRTWLRVRWALFYWCQAYKSVPVDHAGRQLFHLRRCRRWRWHGGFHRYQ